ncbi:MAG: helix-turn-helix transcriptional regulator, partial [Anaerolineaceae bacterium]|nr:helix-turn-helix transcriptional regulator [Anaerolineaceae bacterium]
MKLAEWLRKAGVSRIEFSRRLGLTPGAVSQLCNQESVWMSRETAQAIARETGGAVTPNDFLPEVGGKDKMGEHSVTHSVT